MASKSFAYKFNAICVNARPAGFRGKWRCAAIALTVISQSRLRRHLTVRVRAPDTFQVKHQPVLVVSLPYSRKFSKNAAEHNFFVFSTTFRSANTTVFGKLPFLLCTVNFAYLPLSSQSYALVTGERLKLLVQPDGLFEILYQ